MQITDEMVEKAAILVFEAWVRANDDKTEWKDLPYISPDDYQGCLDAGRAVVKHFAPLIEKSENEACAVIADQGAEVNRQMAASGELNKTRAKATSEMADFLAWKIRARHATPTPSTPQEK